MINTYVIYCIIHIFKLNETKIEIILRQAQRIGLFPREEIFGLAYHGFKIRRALHNRCVRGFYP